MSAGPVRDVFRTQLSGLLAPDFSYVESVNLAEATRDLPPNWYTLDFIAATDSRITLGVPALFRETGRCVVLIFTPHQQQDSGAVDAAEVVRAEMANFRDASGMIRVNEAHPPAEMNGGDFRGAFFGVTVDLAYQYDRYA